MQTTELQVIDTSIEVLRNGADTLRKNIMRSEKAELVAKDIINAISNNGGVMTDELDERCLNFLNKCNQALKEMNEERKPVTQVMDTIKSMFTGAENKIDKSKSGSPAYIIQSYRNAYAQKVAEENKRREEEARRKQEKANEAISIKETATKRMNEYFSQVLLRKKGELQTTFNAITLETFDGVKSTLMGSEFIYPYTHFQKFAHGMAAGKYHTAQEIDSIAKFETEGMFNQFAETYKSEMTGLRDQLLELLPTKKNELINLAEADEEQRKHMEEEKRKREEEEARRIKEEEEARISKQNEQLQMNTQAARTETLFEAEAEVAGNTKTNARASYEIDVLHPIGYGQIFQFWFETEGKNLSIDKIGNTKMSQMKAFAEKTAHSKGSMIDSTYLKYREVFTATLKK